MDLLLSAAISTSPVDPTKDTAALPPKSTSPVAPHAAPRASADSIAVRKSRRKHVKSGLFKRDGSGRFLYPAKVRSAAVKARQAVLRGQVSAVNDASDMGNHALRDDESLSPPPASVAERAASRERPPSQKSMTGTLSRQRTCTCCGTTSTPRWRMGGPKRETLCNACGLFWTRNGSLPYSSRDLGSAKGTRFLTLGANSRGVASAQHEAAATQADLITQQQQQQQQQQQLLLQQQQQAQQEQQLKMRELHGLPEAKAGNGQSAQFQQLMQMQMELQQLQQQQQLRQQQQRQQQQLQQQMMWQQQMTPQQQQQQQQQMTPQQVQTLQMMQMMQQQQLQQLQQQQQQAPQDPQWQQRMQVYQQSQMQQHMQMLQMLNMMNKPGGTNAQTPVESAKTVVQTPKADVTLEPHEVSQLTESQLRSLVGEPTSVSAQSSNSSLPMVMPASPGSIGSGEAAPVPSFSTLMSRLDVQ